MKVSDLAIGSRLVMGRSSAMARRAGECNITWKKLSFDNIFCVRSGIGYYCVDAAEPQNKSLDRRERGSNFFPQTNICGFLNSKERQWFEPKHEADVADQTLFGLPGFLSEFEKWELDLIQPQDVVTTVPDGFKRKFGTQVTTTMLVSMLSKSQVFGGDDLSEGEQLDCFAQFPNDAPRCVLRTACNSGLATIGQHRRLIGVSASTPSKIVPIIKLNGEAEIIFDTSVECYVVMPPQEIVNEIVEELHRLF